MNTAQSINVTLSDFKNNVRQEQISIFHVVCTRLPKEQAIELLKQCHQGNSVVLKSFSTFNEAQFFADDLIAVGANVEVLFDYAAFKKQMTKVQLSIGVGVLFISMVTKSILLFILCLLFIIYLSIELRTGDEAKHMQTIR
jgi:hypothetical protein